MSGIESASARKSSPVEVDYDKPLPGAAEKTRANIANAPWVTDVANPSSAPSGYSSAIYSNPAMYGPAIALAKPPPPARSEPVPLAAAPNALQGVTLALLATGVPSGTRSDASRAFTCGAGYKLYPQLAKQPDGKDAVVYWNAFNTETRRVEFLVGPNALATFTSAPSDYATAAANAFLGEQDAATRESARVVDLTVRKGFAAGIGHLGVASKAAWSDPAWVAKTTMSIVSSAAAAPGTSRAAAAEGRALTNEAGELRAATVAEGPGAGGAIRKVNKDLPLGNTKGTRDLNCANCAIATDATLAGKPACALPGNVTPASEVSRHFGATWSKQMTSAAEVEASMQAAGPGKRAVVFGQANNTPIGHYFNVVNQDGVVRFLDGQSGTTAKLTPYSKFWLLPTN